jgi:type I restriction enzyme S subunit
MPQFQPALVQLWTEMNRNTYVSARGNYQTELLLIPLLPLAEQHRIVAKVDTLLALCDQLEQQLSQDDQQRRRLLLAWPCSNASASRDSSRFATPR